MTITVTPNVSNAPPRNEITVSVAAGSVMSEVALYRNDSAGRSLVRTQPAAGFDSRTVFDYEAPYGESCTYEWTATYTDPTAYSTVFNETWASDAAWTNNADWNTSAGKVRNSVSDPASLYRDVTPAKYRVTVGSIAISPAEVGYVELAAPGAGDSYVLLQAQDGTHWSFIVVVDGVTVTNLTTTILASAPIIVDFNTNTISVSGTGGSETVSANLTVTRVSINNLTAVTANTFQVGAIHVQSYNPPLTLDETSSPVTLDPVDAWLVAPQSPGLSFPLAGGSIVAGVAGVGPVRNASNTTVHKILGSDTPLTVTTGPRDNDVTDMTIGTTTDAERLALRALLAPDIPILIQIPANWDVGFTSGYYQVGDVRVSRMDDIATNPQRLHSLPLTAVQSPIVDVENTGWSYAQLAIEEVSYATVRLNFATYADLAANVRS